MKQRLRGWGGSLSRQAGGRVGADGGGIGGRGPGETKIETDRRRINTKIAKLRRELTAMRGTRETKRQERQRHQIPSVAIAGYTNAGKSSLLNRLTGAGALVEDSLFATLDPTTRRTQTADGRVFTMTDTVGFVRHLPHQIVEAFRSTLEEVADADLVLHVVDGSHPDPEGQIGAVREVFAEIGADKVPELIVINKADLADPMVIARLRQREPHSVVVSARTGEGIAEALRDRRGRAAAAGRRVHRAAALRARRPDRPAAPRGRDRLAGPHRRRHHRPRPRPRGPRRRAGALRRPTRCVTEPGQRLTSSRISVQLLGLGEPPVVAERVAERRVDAVEPLLGRLGELHARADSSAYVAWQSSVRSAPSPIAPRAIRSRSTAAVSASTPGGPGTTSIIGVSGALGGCTVSQRKPSSSWSIPTSKPRVST